MGVRKCLATVALVWAVLGVLPNVAVVRADHGFEVCGICADFVTYRIWCDTPGGGCNDAPCGSCLP